MAELGSVGGVPPLGQGRTGREPQGREQPPAQGGRGREAAAGDHAELKAGAEVAFALLRERTLAFAREQHGLDAVRPAVAPVPPDTARGAVQRLCGELRAMAACAGRPLAAAAEALLLQQAAEAAIAILREVGQWDEPLARWFAAVQEAIAAAAEPARDGLSG